MTTIPPWGAVSTRPRCHACQSVIVVDFRVTDELWEAVVHPSLRNTYMCVGCFASRADEKMIDWAVSIELRPLSLAAQVRLDSPTPLRVPSIPLVEIPGSDKLGIEVSPGTYMSVEVFEKGMADYLARSETWVRTHPCPYCDLPIEGELDYAEAIYCPRCEKRVYPVVSHYGPKGKL